MKKNVAIIFCFIVILSMLSACGTSSKYSYLKDLSEEDYNMFLWQAIEDMEKISIDTIEEIMKVDNQNFTQNGYNEKFDIFMNYLVTKKYNFQTIIRQYNNVFSDTDFKDVKTNDSILKTTISEIKRHYMTVKYINNEAVVLIDYQKVLDLFGKNVSDDVRNFYTMMSEIETMKVVNNNATDYDKVEEIITMLYDFLKNNRTSREFEKAYNVFNKQFGFYLGLMNNTEIWNENSELKEEMKDRYNKFAEKNKDNVLEQTMDKFFNFLELNYYVQTSDFNYQVEQIVNGTIPLQTLDELKAAGMIKIVEDSGYIENILRAKEQKDKEQSSEK